MSIGSQYTGDRLVFGWTTEPITGQGPGASYALRYFRPNLPFDVMLGTPDVASGQTSPWGFQEPGHSGMAQPTITPGFPVRAADLLEPLENIMGAATKTNPDGAYQYAHTPSRSAARRSLYAKFGQIGITGSAKQIFGVELDSLQIAVAAGQPLHARWAGKYLGQTRMGEGVAAGGNTGTYTTKPWIRGPLALAQTAVFVECTQTVGGGGLQFKVEQIGSSPTYPGAAFVVTYDANGNAIWQRIWDDDGSSRSELGINEDGNYDPLIIVFPGDSTAHGAINANDEWSFPAPDAVAALSHGTFPTAQRMNQSNLTLHYREINSSIWIPDHFQSANINLSWPTEYGDPDTVSPKYASCIDRTGVFGATVQVTKRKRNDIWEEYAEQRKLIDYKIEVRGQIIGTAGTNQEGFVLESGRARVQHAYQNAKSTPTALTETYNLMPETTDAGAAPCTLTVNTDRDFTVAT